jgi:proteic killer suppression protein
LRKPALLILDHLAGAAGPGDLQGVRKFHALKGDRAGCYAMWVSGNWRITFVWREGAAHDIDLEDYH